MRRLAAALAAFLALAAPAAAGTRHFLTPGPNRTTCDIDASSVVCLVESPQVPLLNAIRVTMIRTGKLSVCHGLICTGGSTESAPTLAYGHAIVSGPFRCSASLAGVRCVVVKLGHGFVLGSHGVKRV
jgi:hypothetical protein